MGARIGSILWDGVLFAGFMYLLLVMRGKVQPPQPMPFIQQAKLPVKFVIYLGVALFGLLFISDFM